MTHLKTYIDIAQEFDPEGLGKPIEPHKNDMTVEEIEKIIVDWLKSDNENATYCAHLIKQALEDKKKSKKPPVIIKTH